MVMMTICLSQFVWTNMTMVVLAWALVLSLPFNVAFEMFHAQNWKIVRAIRLAVSSNLLVSGFAVWIFHAQTREKLSVERGTISYGSHDSYANARLWGVHLVSLITSANKQNQSPAVSPSKSIFKSINHDYHPTALFIKQIIAIAIIIFISIGGV